MYWGKNTVDDCLLTEKNPTVLCLPYLCLQVTNKLKIQRREVPQAESVETLEYKRLFLLC